MHEARVAAKTRKQGLRDEFLPAVSASVVWNNVPEVQPSKVIERQRVYFSRSSLE